jgi:hypothetical protein
MNPVQNAIGFIGKTFSFTLGKWQIEPTYWQAGVIILLIFLLIVTLAHLRHTYVHWSVQKPSIAFMFYGFIFALLLEGFLLLSGRTLFTEVIGWKNAPKPISTALDAGREKLVKVLGTENAKVPESEASGVPTSNSIISSYQSLSSEDSVKVKEFICKP